MKLAHRKNENNFKKKLKNSWKTLKMAEHILKDTHNPKLNILECDICWVQKDLCRVYLALGKARESDSDKILAKVGEH